MSTSIQTKKVKKGVTLSVLDQSFASLPSLASEALHETIEMAQYCESLGYKRFWVSEHHAFQTLAGSVPEVLLAAIGAATESIRIGSGGIMLPHYSAYKVAEAFSLLANLYPDRVDLGIGRAPGADMSTAIALATDGKPKFERFPVLVAELQNFLENPDATPLVSPRPPKELPIWMLGTSPDSAQLAAEKGLPYNLALFINPQAHTELMRLYRQYFRSQGQGQRPYGTVTMSVFCCESQEQAELNQLTFDINFYRFITGQSSGKNDVWLSPNQAKDYPIDPQLNGFIQQRSMNRAVGTPAQVKKTILKVAQDFNADEVMLVTNMYDFEERKRSFKLVADEFAQ